jgi:hypothetical protein
VPIRFLAALAISVVCACSPTAGNQTEANRSVEYQLSELDRHEFPGIQNLVDMIQGRGARAEVFDLEGNGIEVEDIEERCREVSIPFAGYVIVNDGNPRMLKRYRIENLCGETLRPIKDFGFKNPYQ